jgi:hypothetical protein
MFKTLKHRVASYSTQHLALAFTLVMSFFFNTLLMAQAIEVGVDLTISSVGVDQDNPQNMVSGQLIYPRNTVSQSYNFNVTIRHGYSEGININFGDGQDHFIALPNGGPTTTATFNVTYQDYQPKTITATEVNSIPSSPFSETMKRNTYRAIVSSNYQTPDETVAVAGINMHIKYAP